MAHRALRGQVPVPNGRGFARAGWILPPLAVSLPISLTMASDAGQPRSLLPTPHGPGKPGWWLASAGTRMPSVRLCSLNQNNPNSHCALKWPLKGALNSCLAA